MLKYTNYNMRRVRKYIYPFLDGLRFHITRKQSLYFLHISKTGGTAIRAALSGKLHLQSFDVQFGDHSLTLADVPLASKAIFFLRDPADRFVSGFYSRQRKGQPRYHHEWTAGEAAAFARFSTPDALASALSSSDTTERDAALRAMRAIQHIKHDYSTWLMSLDYLRQREQSIFYIGFQETLSNDFDTIKSLIGAPAGLLLPSDPIEAHRRPMEQNLTLSDRSRCNIKQYFAKDYEIFLYCKDFARQRLRTE
jgi:hypothetical protein